MKKYCGYCGCKVKTAAITVDYDPPLEDWTDKGKKYLQQIQTYYNKLFPEHIKEVYFVNGMDDNPDFPTKIFFTVDPAKDLFIHFTSKEVAEEIKRTRTLKAVSKTKHRNYGSPKAFAASLLWGWHSGIQDQPTLDERNVPSKDIRAVVFKTTAKPVLADSELSQVHWSSDVPIKVLDIVSHNKGKFLLKNSPYMDKVHNINIKNPYEPDVVFHY
jgi:hypothetical protein